MKEQEIKEKYPIGTKVIVDFEHTNFIGTVVRHRNEFNFNFITVRDQDDDHWDCEEKELSLYSDE